MTARTDGLTSADDRASTTALSAADRLPVLPRSLRAALAAAAERTARQAEDRRPVYWGRRRRGDR